MSEEEKQENSKIDITGRKFWLVEGKKGITITDKKGDALQEVRQAVIRGEDLTNLLIEGIEVKEEKIEVKEVSWREIAEIFAKKEREEKR